MMQKERRVLHTRKHIPHRRAKRDMAGRMRAYLPSRARVQQRKKLLDRGRSEHALHGVSVVEPMQQSRIKTAHQTARVVSKRRRIARLVYLVQAVDVQRAHVCWPGREGEGSGCYAAAAAASADAAYLLHAEDALVWIVDAIPGEGGGRVVEEGGGGEVGV